MTKKVYLDRNESQYGPSPRCLEALQKIGTSQLTQYTRDYTRGVKSRVSERLSQDLGIAENKIVLGYGSEGLLKMAIHRYLKEGETLLVPNLSWWYYKAIASEVGGQTVEFDVGRDENSFSFDLDLILEKVHEHRPKVILIASPNNPTGHSLSRESLERLMDQVPDSLVIIDEAYWGFEPSNEYELKELIHRFDNLLVLRTFSKFYALAGVRMGFAVGGERFEGFVKYTTRYLGYSQIAENLVLAAMDDKAYYDDLRKKTKEDKELFYQSLAPVKGVTCFRSDANFLLIRLRNDMVSSLKKELDELGFQIKFFEDGGLKNHIRLSLGTQTQNRLVLKKILKVAEDVARSSNSNVIFHEKVV